MNELDEITTERSIEELNRELAFQVEEMGASLGGAVCSYILHEIELAKRSSTEKTET
jgi:hypothetical protein